MKLIWLLKIYGVTAQFETEDYLGTSENKDVYFSEVPYEIKPVLCLKSKMLLVLKPWSSPD